MKEELLKSFSVTMNGRHLHPELEANLEQFAIDLADMLRGVRAYSDGLPFDAEPAAVYTIA